MNTNSRHAWVTYYNPRNGTVKIKACAHCGRSFGRNLDNTHCGASGSSGNLMRKMGWKIVPTHA